MAKSLTSSINRVFSGWQEPFLPWLANHLIERYRSESMIDMNAALVVLPGANAMRRLLTLLVIESDSLGAALIPPKMITPGHLCDHLLPPTREQATPACRLLGWVSALQKTPVELLKVLIAEPPDPDDFRGWLAFAKRIDALHVEVSAANLVFSEVGERGAELTSFLDEERWDVLEQIAVQYRGILSTQGKSDIYFDRLKRVSESGRFEHDGEIYLAGVVDLNQNVRTVIRNVECDISVLIFAPEHLKDSFDELGAIKISAWENASIPISEKNLEVVEAPKDVVAKMYGAMQLLSADYAISDISIGIGDETEIPYFKGKLNDLNIKTRSASGTRFSQSSVGYLLRGISSYLSSRAFPHFSALIRHPVATRMLQHEMSALHPEPFDLGAYCDVYQERHLQAVVSSDMPEDRKGDQYAVQIVTEINKILLPLLGPAQDLKAWVEQLSGFIIQLAPFVNSSEVDLLHSLVDIVGDLADSRAPMELKGQEALQLVIQLADESLSVPDAHSEAVELLGWLELAHDDAPVTILTSIDEGVVPAVINADPFLPNTLRQHLGLMDNARRYARDAYVLSAVASSKRSCSIIVARRNIDSSKRFPSRLLLACPEAQIPQRITHLFREGQNVRVRRGEERAVTSEFSLVEPLGLEDKIEAMSITSFSDYLSCPYRYYLRHLARAEECRSHLVELDSLAFGNLAHLVLYDFAADKAASSFSPEAINKALNELLDSRVRKQFGRQEYPAIRIQIEALRERLKYFSQWQAGRNRDGWSIVAVEKEISEDDFKLDIPSGTMGIKGKIDRIDHHKAKNVYAIIDYKTGERGKELDNVFEKDKWLDMQIPLYLHAARTFYPDAEYDFLYLNLSAESARTIVTPAAHLLASVDAGITQAQEVAEKVRRGIFWPPAAKVKFDSYSWMLGLRREEFEPYGEMSDE